ncbi:hypothetical protein NERG_02020 [Nematocida ausubeli]|uniref:Uncharacterized protein n=1 Tax=Nematocida ausubeli (strain ATCC PRA-371 / ERTm2) TaxID=1913371 RepID=H8ZEJ9_NEMA1|nr:hypothetical protein NERG_02020 [Nematocida ausubeli]
MREEFELLNSNRTIVEENKKRNKEEKDRSQNKSRLKISQNSDMNKNKPSCSKINPSIPNTKDQMYSNSTTNFIENSLYVGKNNESKEAYSVQRQESIDLFKDINQEVDPNVPEISNSFNFAHFQFKTTHMLANELTFSSKEKNIYNVHIQTIYNAYEKCFSYINSQEYTNNLSMNTLENISIEMNKILEVIIRHREIILKKYTVKENQMLLNFITRKEEILVNAIHYKQETMIDLFEEPSHMQALVLKSIFQNIQDIKWIMEYYKKRKYQIDMETKHEVSNYEMKILQKQQQEYMEEQPDSYAYAILSRIRKAKNNEFWEKVLTPLSKLHGVDTFYVHLSTGLILLSHTIFFVTAQALQKIKSERITILYYYVHMLYNTVLGSLLLVYSLRKIFVAYKCKRNNPEIYKNILSIVQRNKHIIRASILSFISLLVVVGNSFILTLNMDNLIFCIKESVKIVYDRFAAGRVLDGVMLIVFELILALISLTLTSLFFGCLFKRKWLYERKKKMSGYALIMCIFVIYSVIFFIMSVIYDSNQIVNKNSMSYRYHIGYAIQIFCTVALQVHRAMLFLKGSPQIENAFKEGRINRLRYNYIFAIVLVGIISGVICALGLFFYVIDIHKNLIKLSRTNIAKKLPIVLATKNYKDLLEAYFHY